MAIKKFFLFSFVVLLCCSSCTKNVGSTYNTSSLSAEQQIEFISTSDTLLDEYFITVFNSNDIDSEYKKSIENDLMPLDEITENYLDSWKSEMRFTVNQLESFISNDEFYTLQQNLMTWEDAVIDLDQTKRKLLFDSNKSKYGSVFYNDCSAYLASQYREKVKELKYIIFVKETGLDKALYSTDLKSLKFSYIYENR